MLYIPLSQNDHMKYEYEDTGGALEMIHYIQNFR
jgi:hypothetical protein